MTDVKTVLTADPSGAELVKFAEQTATQLVNARLTRSQIRNIFTEVRKIEALWASKPDEALRRLNMLAPKLDYQVARNKEVKGLRDVLVPAIQEVEKAQHEIVEVVRDLEEQGIIVIGTAGVDEYAG